MLRVTCKQFGNDSEAIDIRDHGSQCDDGAVSTTEIRSVRQHPSSEEMCDRAHAGSLPLDRPFAMVTGVMPRSDSRRGASIPWWTV